MKDIKINKSFLKKIGIAILVVFVVIYFAVTLFTANISTKNSIGTEIARRYDFNEHITTDSFIVRNESYLNYSGGKVLYYTVNDGDIVSVGSDVALVFADEKDALNYNKLNEISKEIEKLKRLNTSYDDVRTDFEAVDKQIQLNIKDMISAVNSNSFDKTKSCCDNLVYSINQRRIITGECDNFNTLISELELMASEYRKAGCEYIDVIKSDVSGYFVSSVDGFEKSVNYKNIRSMDVDDFSLERVPAEINENTIGKIISGLNWYVTVKLSPDEAITLSHSNTDITLDFPGTACMNLPAKLVALNQTSKQSEAVAVFECNYMNTPTSHLRNETVKINVNEYSGIRVSKDAIHDDFVTITDDDGKDTKVKVQGVYVLYGGELEFREISIIYSGKDFVIVDEEPGDGVLKSDKTIKLNDEIVIRGDNLYDGKSIK